MQNGRKVQNSPTILLLSQLLYNVNLMTLPSVRAQLKADKTKTAPKKTTTKAKNHDLEV